MQWCLVGRQTFGTNMTDQQCDIWYLPLQNVNWRQMTQLVCHVGSVTSARNTEYPFGWQHVRNRLDCTAKLIMVNKMAGGRVLSIILGGKAWEALLRLNKHNTRRIDRIDRFLRLSISEYRHRNHRRFRAKTVCVCVGGGYLTLGWQPASQNS